MRISYRMWIASGTYSDPLNYLSCLWFMVLYGSFLLIWSASYRLLLSLASDKHHIGLESPAFSLWFSCHPTPSLAAICLLSILQSVWYLTCDSPCYQTFFLYLASLTCYLAYFLSNQECYLTTSLFTLPTSSCYPTSFPSIPSLHSLLIQLTSLFICPPPPVILRSSVSS